MKAWFEWCHMFPGDYPVKFGIDWYVHAKPVKMFKPWRGLTITFYLFKRLVNLNIVMDYEAYQARMNYRHDPNAAIKRLRERKAARENKQ